MLWLLCGPSGAMDSQALVIRIKIPDGAAVDWTVHSAPQLLFRDVLVSEPRRGPGPPPSPGDAGDATVPPLHAERGAQIPPWKAGGVFGVSAPESFNGEVFWEGLIKMPVPGQRRCCRGFESGAGARSGGAGLGDPGRS